MNFLNRAIKNVTRRMSKSILLLITFFVIGNFVIIGLGVSQASESAKTLTRQKMRAVVTYSIDYDAVNKYASEITDEDELNEFYQKKYPRITLNDVKTVLNDERVLAANVFSISQFYQGEDTTVDFVKLNNNTEGNMNGGQSCYVDEASGETVCSTYVEPTFAVKGNYFPNMIEFVDGEYKIVEGRFYDQNEIDEYKKVGLISENLAAANNLKVGDTVTLYSSEPSSISGVGYNGRLGLEADDIKAEFEIIGIYSHNKAITPDNPRFDYLAPFENPDNMILMPATTIRALTLTLEQKSYDYYAKQYPEDEYYKDPANRPSLENDQSVYISDVNILLNDPLEVENFVSEKTTTVGEFIKLDANNEEFNKLAKPLDTLSLYSNFIVWLVVINAVVIITLVTALTLKTREYEIGVLLSVGASKVKIVMQFFVELALVAIIGFTLSIVSGSLIANKVGTTVLNYQIEASDVNKEAEFDNGYYYESIWDSDYTTDITLDDLISEYNVSVSPIIVSEIYIMGLGIVMISILIPSMMIMRFNPKRILMNQN